jgi:hypothetical protein
MTGPISVGWLRLFKVELPLTLVTGLLWTFAPAMHFNPLFGGRQPGPSDLYLLLVQAFGVTAR